MVAAEVLINNSLSLSPVAKCLQKFLEATQPCGRMNAAVVALICLIILDSILTP